jgi:glycosyltransferase involved in cell wall biosynthesis
MGRATRLTIVHSFYRTAGGEDHYVRSQINLMRARHAVQLIERRNEELPHGLATIARMTWSSRQADELERELREFRPDIVHVHNAYPALGPAVHAATRRLRIPLVMTVHNQRLRCPNGLTFTQGRPCRRCEPGRYVNAVRHDCFSSGGQAAAYAASLWIHRFVLGLEHQVALFVAPSEFMRDRLLEWGIAEHRVAMIRNFASSTAGASAELGRYGLYLGRLSAEKGLHELLQALRQAGDPPFLVVGDGPSQPALRRLAGELELGRTRFLGRVDRQAIPGILRGARYAVTPSLCDENAPLGALEAMAEGRPLLVTRAGGLPELVRQGSGLMCERGSVAELAARIRRLEGDDDLCRTAGASALAFARRELDPGLHRRRLQDAYARVTADRPPA